MSEQEQAAQEAAAEIVQPEAEQVEAPEAVEITEEQPQSEQPDEDGDSTPDDDQPPKPSRWQRQKEKLNQARQAEKEALAKAEEVTARLEALRNAAQSQQPPKEADFADYNEYMIAMAAHQSVAALDRRQSTDLEREADEVKRQFESLKQQSQQAAQEAWQEQVTDAKTRYADFDAVVSDPSLPISPDMAEVIRTSPKGADLAYYLGTHRAAAAQIAQLTPLEAARELGAIEARISLPKANSTTSAPDPITPVSPKASARKDPSKMTMAEWRAYRSGKA